MAVDKILINSLEDLQRESTRLRDEQERIVEEANKKVFDASLEYKKLLDLIANGQVQFDADNKQRIEVLSARQLEIETKENDVNDRLRALEASEESFRKFISNATKEQSDLSAQNKEALATNRAILADIALNQAALSKEKQEVLALREDLEIKSSQVELSMKTAALVLEQGDSLRNEAIKNQVAANATLREAEEALKSVNGIKAYNIALINELDAKRVTNEQELKAIAAASHALEAKGNELTIKASENAAALKTLQDGSERNKAEMIALRALQQALNAKEREIKEREANLKALEAKAIL